MNPEKLPMIAVIGSGTESHSELSFPLGKWLAENGFHLINGGGGGVMAETAHAFIQVANRKGKVIGIIPSKGSCDSEEERADFQSPAGYPNAYTEITIRTHLPHSGLQGKKISSRNHIIVLSADVVIALPGGPGTRSEIELALEYGKTIIFFSPNGEWKEFGQQAETVATMQDVIQKLNK